MELTVIWGNFSCSDLAYSIFTTNPEMSQWGSVKIKNLCGWSKKYNEKFTADQKISGMIGHSNFLPRRSRSRLKCSPAPRRRTPGMENLCMGMRGVQELLQIHLLSGWRGIWQKVSQQRWCCRNNHVFVQSFQSVDVDSTSADNYGATREETLEIKHDVFFHARRIRVAST